MLTRGILGEHLVYETIIYLIKVRYRPMSQISAIFGTDDDTEILNSLYTIVNVSLALAFVSSVHMTEMLLEHCWARIDPRVAVDI
jgi:hypothetical protein